MNRALSVHTVYCCEYPKAHFAEVFRLLESSGRFVLGYRSTQDKRAIQSFPSTVYTFRIVQEIEDGMCSVGFANVTTVTEQMESQLMHWTIADKA